MSSPDTTREYGENELPEDVKIDSEIANEITIDSTNNGKDVRFLVPHINGYSGPMTK